jgi:hypothetical protein
VQRTCLGTAYLDGKTTKHYISSTFRFTIELPVDGFIFWITLTPSGVQCTVTKDSNAGISNLWSKVDTLKGDGLSSSVSMPNLGGFMSHIGLQSISIGKDAANKAWWEVTSVLNCSKSFSKDPVDIYLTYNSLASTFSSGLILH